MMIRTLLSLAVFGAAGISFSFPVMLGVVE
jgi:hypothetical protein